MQFHNSYWKVLPYSVDHFMTKVPNYTLSSLRLKVHNSVFFVHFLSSNKTQQFFPVKCLIHLKCSSSAFSLEVDSQSHLVLERPARPPPLTQSGCKAGARHLALAAGGTSTSPATAPPWWHLGGQISTDKATKTTVLKQRNQMIGM